MPPPLSLGLEHTHVLITGGAGLIGSAVARAFFAEGAHVSSIDLADPAPPPPPEPSPSPSQAPDHSPPSGTLTHYRASVTDEPSFARAWRAAVRAHGPVQCCVALAGLDLSVLEKHERASETLGLEAFMRTMEVNVGGVWVAGREWLRGVRAERERQGKEVEEEKEEVEKKKKEEEGGGAAKERIRNCSLVIVGSESGWFGERARPDYAAAKSAVQGGLLRSLAAEAGRVRGGVVRVNAVAPGPVDTARFREECRNDPEQLWLDAQATTGLAEPVPMEAVARSILFLASENFSSHVHGQVLNVDSGKQGKLLWTKEQIEARTAGQP